MSCAQQRGFERSADDGVGVGIVEPVRRTFALTRFYVLARYAQGAFATIHSRLKYLIDTRCLSEVVADDPIAAVLAFHKILQIVWRALLVAPLNERDLMRDGFATTGNGGVFGDLSAIYGAIEAQMRGSLHIHALLFSLGFSSPHFLRDKLRDSWDTVLSEFWEWARSTLFCSAEEFATYLYEDVPIEQRDQLATLLVASAPPLEVPGKMRTNTNERLFQDMIKYRTAWFDHWSKMRPAGRRFNKQ